MRINIKASSVAPSLAVLLLMIVVGMVAIGAFVSQIQYVGVAVGESAIKAADIAREKLQIYIWKNVSSPYNITMVTILNKGSIEATIEYAVAIDYSGNPLKEHKLDITIPPSGRVTRQLADLLGDSSYASYEDVKSRIRTIYFKTVRGNVFGSTYSAPEALYRVEAATLTVNGTTITVTKTSLEEFTPVSEMTITRNLTITRVTGRPYWDVEVYVVTIIEEWPTIRITYSGRKISAPIPVFTEDELPIPDWAKPSDGRKIYVPKAVSSNAVFLDVYEFYIITPCDQRNAKTYPYVGRWIIDVKPRPVWVTTNQSATVFSQCSGKGVFLYIYKVAPVVYEVGETPYKYCAFKYEYSWVGDEVFYPITSIPSGEYVIKAPDQIKLEYRHVCDDTYYITFNFDRFYYVVYDAFNMSNIIFMGNASEARITVDRPLRIAFFYKYSDMKVKLRPPPQPPPPVGTVVVEAPNVCISDDFDGVGGFKGNIEFHGRTVVVKCDNCQAYIAPGYGVWDLSEVKPCPGNVCNDVPLGRVVIIDGDPEK